MDDEEYSYKSYSADTQSAIDGKKAAFKDNEEVYTYSAYADEPVKKQPFSYGDFIVEEFSAENNVPRVARITGLSTGVVTYIFAAAYLVVGVLCIALTERVTSALPYIVGGLMILIGLWQFITALIHREYRQTKTNQTAMSLIVIALGVMIILEHLDPESNWAITFISIVWGIIGLFEGAHAFNHAFKRIANSERSVFYLIKGIVECAVAFMLLYQPDDHDIHHFHIIVFGINLIWDAVTMIPFVKTFLSMK